MSKLKKLERAAKKKPNVPSSDEPREELRRLVLQHKSLTKASVAIDNMARDKKNRETGETIKCRLPEDAAMDLQESAKRQRDRASKLESAMRRELKRIPVYQHFLSKVFGLGPVVSAYLVAEVDITRCEKPSQLRRFCGMAVINGRLERPTRGQKNAFSREMRTRLFQAFASMWKNAAKTPGGTTKYLATWTDYKHRMRHSPRYDSDANTLAAFEGDETRKGAKALIHAAGWHKACDILLGDLYTVWRTLEGLPVWCTYYDKVRGHMHGGQPAPIAPRLLTLDQALEMVGEVGMIVPPVAAE